MLESGFPLLPLVDVKRARDLLPAVLQTSAESPERNQDWVFAFWDETVGPTLAKRTRPILLQRRLLIVEVDGLDWVTQLERIAPRLVRELNRSAGGSLVSGIAFRLAKPERKPPAVARSSRPEGEEPGLDPMRRRAYRASRGG